MVRTLLAMHGGLLRGALRYVLSTQDDIEVVADGDSLDGVPAGPLDVAVLDLDVLGGSAGSVRELAARLPDVRLLVLVDPRRTGLIQPELAGGPPGVGFLAQTVPPERVVDAVRRLARGEPVLDATLVVAALSAKGPLTAREKQVLEVAALGLPVKEIAAKLGRSPGTVRNHLSRIIAKTGARTRIEAIHIARDRGWI